MTLIKTSLLSLIATMFRVGGGLVITKLLALYVGPSGLALLGQFQDLQRGVNGVATAGLGQGLIKYLSEFKDNLEKSQAIFATAVKLVTLLLLPVSFCLLMFSSSISGLVFDDEKYAIWVIGLGICIIPSSLSGLLLATLNGIREIRKLTVVGISSSLLSAGIAALAIPTWGVMGGVVSFLVTPFLVLFTSLFMLGRSNKFSVGWFKPRINRDSAKKLGKFMIMAAASAVSIPVSHILIRNNLTEVVSQDAAGIWTGMWRVSSAYLMVVTSTLVVYYLPKLSELKDAKSIKKEIRYGQVVILPFVVISALCIYFSRDWIILLLFDKEFLLMRDLFAFQLIGDFIKISCFLYGYLLHAKAMFVAFAIKEVVISAIFVMLSYALITQYDLVGVTYAYIATYFINLLWLLILVKMHLTKIGKP